MKKQMIVLSFMVVVFFIFDVFSNLNEVPVKATDANVIALRAEDVLPLPVGETIPSLVLMNADGNEFNLNKKLGKQPAVIIFYRGGWCPYCNVQLGQLKSVELKLLELGYQIIAISPDRLEKLGESVKKHQLKYTLLSDHSMIVAKAFGIAFRVDSKTLTQYNGYGIDIEDASGETHHLLPVPSVFIVGTDGVIKFSYTNPDYKVRIALEDLLKAAQMAKEV